MKKQTTYNRDRRGIWLLLSLLFYSTLSFAINTDSIKNKWDINDPRNPNCPCHKYQKMADEEYKKLVLKERKENSSALLKKKTDIIPAKKTSPKVKKTRRVKDKISACFHWRG